MNIKWRRMGINNSLNLDSVGSRQRVALASWKWVLNLKNLP
jgi:hypothetical protein